MPISFYAITGFINFLTSAVLAVLVVLKNRKNSANIVFFILSTLIALWSLSYYFWQITDNEYWALFWCRVLMYSVIFIPATYLHFASAFVGILEKRIWKIIIALTYFLFFLFFLIDLTPYFIEKVEPVMNFKYWPMATPIFSAYLFFFTICVAVSSFLLIRRYQTTTGIIKLQAKYVAIGMIFSFVAGCFNWLPWYKISIPPITNMLVPTYVILIAYAITRYRLMDVRIIARQIFFYFGISFLVYATFYLVSWLYILFFGSVFTQQSYLIGLFIAPLFAVVMYNGGMFLSNFVNKYFFSSLYDYQKTINNVSKELSSYTDLNKIIGIVVDTIEKSLEPNGIALLLADPSMDGKSIQLKTAKFIGFAKQNNISSVLDYDLLSYYFGKKQKVLIKEELEEKIRESKDRYEKKMLLKLKKQIDQIGIQLCLSLVSREKFFGIIILGPKFNDDPYTQKDFELLGTLSYQAGIAIDNASLYKKIEEKNEYLQELLSIKNDFIRIANHQLNTPLSIMRNAYSMVKEGTLTPKRGLVYWGEGIERMSQVLKNFWYTFEVEAGRTRIAAQKIDVGEIIKKSVEQKKKIIWAMRKKITITVEKPNFQVPFVWYNPRELTHIFSNLLENAIFYTPKGAITISYKLVESKTYLKISIKDAGIGIPQQDQDELTQKFYRSKKAITTHPDGSGLGLYISKRIVENNGGEFSFYSEGENKGSTFSFTVPVYKDKNKEFPPQSGGIF